MDENVNLTDKKIKTGAGTEVNITCSYAEDKTLEELFLSYLKRANAVKKLHNSGCLMIQQGLCHTCDW